MRDFNVLSINSHMICQILLLYKYNKIKAKSTYFVMPTYLHKYNVHLNHLWIILHCIEVSHGIYLLSIAITKKYVYIPAILCIFMG